MLHQKFDDYPQNYFVQFRRIAAPHSPRLVRLCNTLMYAFVTRVVLSVSSSTVLHLQSHGMLCLCGYCLW